MLKLIGLIMLLSAGLGVAMFAYGIPVLPSVATSAAIAAVAVVVLIGLLWLNGFR